MSVLYISSFLPIFRKKSLVRSLVRSVRYGALCSTDEEGESQKVVGAAPATAVACDFLLKFSLRN